MAPRVETRVEHLMDLELTETQALLRDTVTQYLEQEVPFERIRELEKERRSDAQLWKAVCEQGWIGVAVGESLGGAGGSLVDLGLVVETVARRAALAPILEVAACARVIERFAERALARETVGGILEGSVIVVPAMLEDDDRWDACTTTFSAEDGVRGHKSFVDHAAIATHHLVRAEGPDGPLLALVDARGEGVSTASLTNVGWTPSARVEYDGAAAAVVATGAEPVAALIRLGRALAAVQIVGAMASSLDGAVEYAKVREQFGKPIGSFQAVRHHAANMSSRVASARLLAFEALSRIDAGKAADREVASAKASASRAAPEVTMLAHQIFGGNGVILENDHYFFTLRARERASAGGRWTSASPCSPVTSAPIRTGSERGADPAPTHRNHPSRSPTENMVSESEPHLLVERRADGVMILTMNRPEQKNALSPEMLVRLNEAWHEFRDSSELRVAILTGAGDTDFCAGGDLKLTMPLMTGARQPERRVGSTEADVGNMSQFTDAILRGFELYKPVIAAVNGQCALGGGTEMTNACDLRVARPTTPSSARPRPRSGLLPGGGSLTRLPQPDTLRARCHGDADDRRSPSAPQEALAMGLAQTTWCRVRS